MECKFTKGLTLDARMIRQSVFVEEQGFRLEFDDIDERAIHVVVYTDGECAATGRLFSGGDTRKMTIGRVAVIRGKRGTGLGRAVIEALEQKAHELGAEEVELSAQVRVKEFYENLGYTPHGGISDDEGVPHIKMIKRI